MNSESGFRFPRSTPRVCLLLVLLLLPLRGSAWADTPGVEVRLDASNDRLHSLPLQGRQAPFLVLELLNHGPQTVELRHLALSRTDLADEASIAAVSVYAFQPWPRTHGRSFTEDERIAPLNLTAEPISIPAGSDRPFTEDEHIARLPLNRQPIVLAPHSRQIVTVALDLTLPSSYEGTYQQASLVDASSLELVNAATGAPVPVSGDFPLVGQALQVRAVASASLNFSFDSVADQEIEVGETNVELCRIEIEETSGEEDVLLRAMTLEFEGIIDGELANLYVEHQGERISEIVGATVSNAATFNFTGSPDGGWLLADGDSRTVRLRGDVVGGAVGGAVGGGELTINFDEVQSDIIATGLTYGFGVAARMTTKNGPSPVGDVIHILGGDINFAVNSTARDIATDTDNISFGH